MSATLSVVFRSPCVHDWPGCLVRWSVGRQPIWWSTDVVAVLWSSDWRSMPLSCDPVIASWRWRVVRVDISCRQTVVKRWRIFLTYWWLTKHCYQPFSENIKVSCCTYLDLDLVPPVPDGTLGDEISPPVSIVGSSPCTMPSQVHSVKVFLKWRPPGHLWSTAGSSARFWYPGHGYMCRSDVRQS